MRINFANSLDGVDWDDCAWALDGDFKEEDHTRGGDPDNPGRFSKGAGGAGAGGGEGEHAEVEREEPEEGESEAEGGAEEEGGEGEAEKKVKSATGHLREAGPDRESWPEHIQKLVIPPAWTELHISDDANADLLATGKDKKGRKQYVYSERFAKSQAALKFARMEALRQEKPMIETQLGEYRKSPDRKQRDLADCTTLVMKMGVRPGSDSDTKAEKKAYGASTLEGQHVVEENGQVYLRFTGKKGVALNLAVEDKGLAANLRSRAKKAGPSGRLFGEVNSGSLLGFVHELDGGSFKTKDFRTALANDLAMKALKGAKKPKDAKEYKKAVTEVAKQVSSRLGNTPSVALASYIHPAVFADWKEAATKEPVKKKKRKKRRVKAKPVAKEPDHAAAAA